MDQGKGEHCDITNNGDNAVLTFYKDAGTSNPGLNAETDQRTINITVVTALSDDWLNWSANTNDTDSLTHINKVTADTGDKNISTDQAEAIIAPAKKTFEETINEKNSQLKDTNNTKYPYFKYRVIVEPIKNNSVTITDTMPSDFTILDRNWTHYSANQANIPSDAMTFWGTNDINDPKKAEKINCTIAATTAASDSEDTNKYDITISNIPDEAKNYSYCYLTYYLIPKDETALKNIDKNLTNDDNNNAGYYELINTAANKDCADIESQAKTQYVNEDTILKKELTKADFTNTTYGDYVADYQVDINSKERKIAGDAGKFDVTDKVDQDYLSLDISSLSFKEGDSASTNVNSCSILYGDNGRPVGFTANVNDKKHITVTYRVKIDMTKFSNGQDIDLENSVSNSMGLTVSSKQTKKRESAYAYSTNPGIYIVKTDSVDASKKLKATFALLDKDQNPVKGKNGEVTITTNEKDGVGTVMGDQDKLGWVLEENTLYYLKEITPPSGYALNDTLIPFKITKNKVDEHINTKGADDKNIDIYYQKGDDVNVYKIGYMLSIPNTKAPDTPKTPETPKTPDTPKTPETPVTPQQPETPTTTTVETRGKSSIIPTNPVNNGEDMPNTTPKNKTKSPKTGERNIFFSNWFE